MKATIFFISFFCFISCASLDSNVYEARQYCYKLAGKGQTTEQKRKYFMEVYPKCVPAMTQAIEHHRLTDYFGWIFFGIPVLSVIFYFMVASAH